VGKTRVEPKSPGVEMLQHAFPSGSRNALWDAYTSAMARDTDR